MSGTVRIGEIAAVPGRSQVEELLGYAGIFTRFPRSLLPRLAARTG